MTKQQLIDQWLARHPQDAQCPDLEFNAVAWYVSNPQGEYVLHREWLAAKQART